MSSLRQSLHEYLELRQALGFKLQNACTLLPQFVAFLEAQGATFIITDEAVRWATQPQHVQPAEWARRLRWVRGFARYHHAIDSRTEIPPTQINYHPQSGWFEDTPLKGGTEEGCPLKGVHEGTCLIEARQPAWNHSRASGLTVVSRLGLLRGVGSGTPPSIGVSQASARSSHGPSRPHW